MLVLRPWPGRVSRLGPPLGLYLQRVHQALQRHPDGEADPRPPGRPRGLTQAVRDQRILDEYVIGQHGAKKTLAVAVYNHDKRIFSPPIKDEVELEIEILLIGPTADRQTLLAQTVSKILKVPFSIIARHLPLTEAGYVGEDVENIWSGCFRRRTSTWQRRARDRLHRRDRQDLAQEREPFDHPRCVGRRRAAGAVEILEGTW